MGDQLSIYYNGELPEARTLLGYAQSMGVPVKAIDIRKEPLTPLQLLTFSYRMDIPIEDLVRTDHLKVVCPDLGSLSAEDWARVLFKEPRLLRKPIGQRKNRVKLLDTASDIMQL